MENQTVITVLNELLTLEQASPAPRLLESTVFVSHLSSTDLPVVKHIADASQQHCAQLASLIQDLGGTPGLRCQDLMTGDLHFQELHSALPRLICEFEILVSKYKSASHHVSSHAGASSLINEILKQLEASLQELQSHQNNQTETVV